MGDLWMDAGNFEKANGHYQSASSMTSDSFSRLLANYSLGVAKESEGKYSEAIASYSAALDAQGSDFIRPEILMAQARCYEALKDVKRAIEIYKTVQEKYSSRAYYSGAASAYEKQLSAGAQ
jgi:tetratricopeptide (TPR) repeat protein